ncbi:helicase C-terminal domain-containing protein [Pedosphaera parvula]|nr:helicase C-terminal domain-containing protein [Pedosphaera parvula]
MSKPVFSVRVRDLVQFSLRSGNLGGERDFVGSDRALAGTRGHHKIQRSRPSGYQKEVPVSYDIETNDLILRIRGRIDDLFVNSREVLLEEIKTIQGTWDRTADPLHWAQAKIYAFIYAHEQALKHINIQLTYLNLDTDEVTELREVFSFSNLSLFFEAVATVYVEWIQERFQWCRERDRSIQALAFPFSNYRTGQREIAVAAYKIMARGGRLFIEAPTGIGKTISVIFPAIKAMAERKLERIFYLTARTIGRAVAEKAFADLRGKGLQLRVVTLTAREKLCIRDGKACELSTCPLAQGYYDRYKPAMREALGRQEINRRVLEEVAQRHQVCPFELSLDISSWVDGIICDYNYVFDPKVYLRRHFADEAGDFAFLVDEAHNLVDRAREMFSADINTRELVEVKQAIKREVPGCAKAITRLNVGIKKLIGKVGAEAESSADFPDEMDLFSAGAVTKTKNIPSATTRTLPQARGDMGIFKEFPSSLTMLVEDVLETAETWLTRNEAAEFRDDLLQLYFRLLSFRRTAELYDERYVTLVEAAESVRVRLFCLDPSFLLQQALSRGKAAVFFSATLTPINYYRELLGGNQEDPVLQLNSPFDSEHLALLVHGRIRTDFKARRQTLSEVVHAIATLVQERSGNYLVYFPSFLYLNAVLELFQSLYPTVPVLTQRPGMAESERETFLAAFSVEHGQTLVGFAVLGGIFGEGIDLVGDRLIGAVIIGVGLPQLCAERDLIRDYFQEKTGAGFDYAYTFPGMNRVLQATGRVIRSETDRGIVLLIDSRFDEWRYRKLFPKWWHRKQIGNEHQLREAVQDFWRSVS